MGISSDSVSFLAPFLMDDAILSWDAKPKLDLTRKVREIFFKLRDCPFEVTKEDVREVVWDKESQIRNKDAYWKHITDVAGIYSGLVAKLGEKKPGLDIPEPKIAYARGLVHDIDSAFARYRGELEGHKFAQHDKQLTEYFVFRVLGLDKIAKEVPMHCAYFELLKMISQGKGFSEVKLYEGWTRALNDSSNPLNFEAISQGFNLFLQGIGNFPLITLTLSDYLDNGNPIFNKETMEQDFVTRRDDLLERYYYSRTRKRQEPSALGIALVDHQGVERINKYFGSVKGLLD